MMTRIALALLYFSVTLAQAEESTDVPPRYAVEVVIFQYMDQSRSTAETPPPPPSDALEMPTPSPTPRPAGPRVEFLLLDPAAGAAALTQLEPDQLTLGGAWRRLERLDAYRPLAYLSWSQLALGRDASPAFRLADVGVTPPGLSGQVQFSKERFAHLALDLSWQETDSSTAGGTGAALPAARIKESRRLRGDLVQYFDNPRFGAIAYVRELEVPEAAAADDVATGPAG